MDRSTLRHGLLAVALTVGAVHVVGSLHTGDLPGNGDSWVLGVASMGHAVLGWTVIGRRPGLRIGWLLLCGGVVGTASNLSQWWAQESVIHHPGSLPWGSFGAWLAAWSGALPAALVVALPLVLFPSGTPRSPRWRVFLVLVSTVFVVLVALAAVLAVPVAFRAPSQLLDGGSARPGSLADAVTGFSSMAWLLAFVVAAVGLVGLIVARRRARGDERLQYTTVLIGGAALLVSLVATSLVGPLTGDRHQAPEGTNAVFWLAIPTAIAIAIVRYRLYDLRILIRRSMLVGVVGALLAGTYFVVLAVVARVVGSSTHVSAASLVAAGAVGLTSVFAASAITSGTRRWFGRDTGAHVVAARLHDNDEGPDTGVTLERLATIVRDELHLGTVELVLPDGTTVRTGEHDGPTTSVELSHAGRPAGQLVVTARRSEALSRRDLELLDQIGRYVALATEAIRTAEDLVAAQHALENAHADERRRLRMDLHDGLGPTLAAVRLKLVAHARNATDSGPVTEAAEQVSDAIREVRRIVDGLQPSIVEDLGLLPAVHILIADVQRASNITFTLETSNLGPDVPALVAAAAYRTVAELVANVTRHSAATSCHVTITGVDGSLDVIVEDDGRGFDPDVPAGGMGLRSIAARARNIGGDALVTSVAGHGTKVAARLPIDATP